MSKKLCEKDEKKKKDSQKNDYVCKKCGANSNKEKHLCKPEKIK